MFQKGLTSLRITKQLGVRLFTSTRQRLAIEGSSPNLPRGCFSEYEAVRNKEVTGGILREEQTLPKPATTWEMEASGLRQLHFSKWPIFWSNRKNVTLHSSSHIHTDEEGRACWEAMYGAASYMRDEYWKTIPYGKKRILSGSWTSISSQWTTPRNYYHWFTDALTRLIYLEKFPQDIGILIHSDTTLPSYAIDSLKRLGVWERVLVTNNKLLKVEDYWFSSPTAMTGCPNPLGLCWLRDRLIGPVTEQDGSGCKIFITRNGGTRSLRDSQSIEKELHNDGWIVIEPGNLTLEEQIDIFSKCARIRGIHGAGMTNELWCKTNTPIEECIPSNYRNGCYEAMSLSLGHRHNVAVMDSDEKSNIIYNHTAFKSNH